MIAPGMVIRFDSGLEEPLHCTACNILLFEKGEIEIPAIFRCANCDRLIAMEANEPREGAG